MKKLKSSLASLKLSLLALSHDHPEAFSHPSLFPDNFKLIADIKKKLLGDKPIADTQT